MRVVKLSTREKMRAAHKNKTRVFSQEHKENIKQSALTRYKEGGKYANKSQPIVVRGITYDSKRKAMQALGINYYAFKKILEEENQIN